MLKPTNKRAWTLQEQLIPNRLLIYASHTLKWRCNAGVKNLGSSLNYAIFSDNERYSETISSLHRPATEREDQLKRWLKIIQIYSGRRAPLATDKLTALAGIAKEFSDTLGSQYHAGLWEYSLLLQLTWKTRLPPDTTEHPCTRPITYRSPSWSWASIEGRVSFHPNLFEEDESDRLYRCSLIRCGNNGQIDDSSLRRGFGWVVAAKSRLATGLADSIDEERPVPGRGQPVTGSSRGTAHGQFQTRQP